MKNWSSIILCFIILSLNLACKKGKDDPFISFRTRSSRLIGEWKIPTYHVTGKVAEYLPTENYGPYVERIITIENDVITSSYSDSLFPIGTFPYPPPPRQLQHVVETGSVDVNTITFSKDGTWTRNLTYTLPTNTYYLFVNGTHSVYNSTIETNNTQHVIQSSGKWNFIHKPGYKKNECITLTKLAEALDPQNPGTFQTGSYSSKMIFVDGTNVQTWRLNGLKNKEIEFELIGTYEDYFSGYGTLFTEESGTCK